VSPPVTLEREGARIVFGWMRQPIPDWEPFAQAGGAAGAAGRALTAAGPRHTISAHITSSSKLGSKAEVAALEPDILRSPVSRA
jgi:hypothetical protein